MPETSNSTAHEPQNSQEVIQMFQEMRQEIQQLSEKINEFENETREHQLVIEALTPLDPNRKCFRLIGGVLVERNVAEVLPAVKNNKTQLEDFVKKLEEQRDAKNKDMSDFQSKYKIRMKNQGDDTQPDEKKPAASSQGVLV
uniref:Prefoldin subunit 2 n=1 Tax=Tetraselmis sp. GSL018 TaxID=582737 RepID=A0A061R0Z9_9CHLO